MATADTAPLPDASPEPIPHESLNSAGEMEDVMANGTATGEIELGQDPTPSTQSAAHHLAMQSARPTQDPPPAALGTETSTDASVDAVSFYTLSASDPTLALSTSEIVDHQPPEEAREGHQTKIDSSRGSPSLDTSHGFAPDATPAHIQATTAPSASRNLASTQSLEVVPVQMANNEQGSAARLYINTRITPVLLEGMKWVAKNEPEKPLKWLSEYLARRSLDMEGV